MPENCNHPILPPAWLGVLGGGQLGRMFAMAAKQMGYFVCVFSPENNSPAGQVSDCEVNAEYTDEFALAEFCSKVDAVTIEFENIPSGALKFLAQHVPVRPGPHVLYVTQNRLREKTFLSEHQFPVGPYYPILSEEDLPEAMTAIQFPAVLKTAGFGYDGKGQVKITQPSELAKAFAKLGQSTAFLEQFVDFKSEVSVIGVRGVDGEFTAYGPVENLHRHHILDLSICPADVLDETLARHAVALTRQVMEALDVIGLLCVEFFLTRDDCLLINELAPRPHNSGHYTIDACPTSQFEQQVRALCGLPLGSTGQRLPAAMVQLLGDCWYDSEQLIEPNWAEILKLPDTHLHLYGKAEARSGRKMGHITTLAPTTEQAAKTALDARDALCKDLSRL